MVRYIVVVVFRRVEAGVSGAHACALDWEPEDRLRVCASPRTTAIADAKSCFELKERYGKSAATVLARLVACSGAET